MIKTDPKKGLLLNRTNDKRGMLLRRIKDTVLRDGNPLPFLPPSTSPAPVGVSAWTGSRSSSPSALSGDTSSRTNAGVEGKTSSYGIMLADLVDRSGHPAF
jgi:hypothetical protein